jgi:N-methylhydantoinase A
LRDEFQRLQEEARCLLASEGFSSERMRFARILDCRYDRQIFSVEVGVSDEDLAAPNTDWLTRKFEASYEALYQHSHKNVPAFIDTCRIAAFGIQPPLVLKESSARAVDPSAAQHGVRRIYFGSWVQAPVYWFDDLAAGMVIEGPALVDSTSTSVVIVPGSTAVIDRVGSIQITRNAK